MRILVTGGGTGGHIYPAVAVIDSLKEMDVEVSAAFVGTRMGLEGGIVPTLGYKVYKIAARPMPERKDLKIIPWLVCNGIAFVQSVYILLRERPHAVLATGGYASGSCALAASMLGIPVVLIEPNSIPGRTTLMLSRFVDEVALGYKECISRFPKGTNLRVTGVPIRKEILGISRSEGIAKFRLDEDRLTVFVFGGSRGASRINHAVVDAVKKVKTENIQFLIQTGYGDYEWVRDEVRSSGFPCKVFAYVEKIGYAYAACDLVVSRAGAVTLAEITACGLPAILVPYPHAVMNHQFLNAQILEKAGAAAVIKDEDLGGESLARAIDSIISDPQTLKSMSEKARSLAREDAATEVAAHILQLRKLRRKLSRLTAVLSELCSVR